MTAVLAQMHKATTALAQDDGLDLDPGLAWHDYLCDTRVVYAKAR
jgi:hypothetical protein